MPSTSSTTARWVGASPSRLSPPASRAASTDGMTSDSDASPYRGTGNARRHGGSRTRSRRKPLPLFSTLTISMPPMCLVDATCVPPSAWVSSPTMSTIRTSVRSGRQQVGRRADDVGDRVGLVARQHLDVDPAVRVDLDRAGRGDRVLEALRHLGKVEVHPRLERLHVAAGDERAEVAEDDAGEQVQPGVGAHQRRTPVVVERALHRGSGRRDRVALGGDQVDVVGGLAGAGDPGLHAAPEQHAVVGRLAAAAGIERGAVEHDAVGVSCAARPPPSRAASGRSAPADGSPRLAGYDQAEGDPRPIATD